MKDPLIPHSEIMKSESNLHLRQSIEPATGNRSNEKTSPTGDKPPKPGQILQILVKTDDNRAEHAAENYQIVKLPAARSKLDSIGKLGLSILVSRNYSRTFHYSRVTYPGCNLRVSWVQQRVIGLQPLGNRLGNSPPYSAPILSIYVHLCRSLYRPECNQLSGEKRSLS
jgi:hypothetical protein